MGRNKSVRIKIAGAGHQRRIEQHQNKIRLQRMKPYPDEELIAHWQAEIDRWEKQIERLTRRLKRNW